MDKHLEWVCKNYKDFDRHFKNMMNPQHIDDGFLTTLVIDVYKNYSYCSGFVSALHAADKIGSTQSLTLQQSLFSALKTATANIPTGEEKDQ